MNNKVSTGLAIISMLFIALGCVATEILPNILTGTGQLDTTRIAFGLYVGSLSATILLALSIYYNIDGILSNSRSVRSATAEEDIMKYVIRRESSGLELGTVRAISFEGAWHAYMTKQGYGPGDIYYDNPRNITIEEVKEEDEDNDAS